jgi:hypothetical protein
MEGLEKLKDQMESMEKSIASAVSDWTVAIDHNTHPFPSGDVYP